MRESAMSRKRQEAIAELGRRAAAGDSTRAAYEDFQRDEEQEELTEALEDMSVEELTELRTQVDAIIRDKRAGEAKG
jgi:predicted house-cleaning noncanonical NTP pyrophosphatase (MazG superfamily)